MDNHRPNRHGHDAGATFNRRSGIATVAAAFLGSLTGGVMASTLPADKFSWTGLALVPFFLLIESYLKYFATLFGGNSNAARVTLVGAVVLSFYVTWFATRSG